MAKFWTTCDLRVVEDCGSRPVVMLIEPLQYESDLVGNVLIPSGFVFDGASIPQIAMSVTGWPGIRAACIHDWLVMQPDYDRRTADKVFREALDVCGVDSMLADVMYEAVRMYSRSVTYKPDDESPVGA